VATQAKSVWALLELPPGASKADIRKQFKRFVRTEHPDIKGESTPESVEKFTNIMKSYREIMASDEDLFWLESWCARVEAVNIEKRKAYLRRRERKLQAYMAAKAAQEKRNPVEQRPEPVQERVQPAPDIEKPLRTSTTAAATKKDSLGVLSGFSSGQIVAIIFASIATVVALLLFSIQNAPKAERPVYTCIARNMCVRE